MQTMKLWQVFFVMATTLVLVSWVKQAGLSDYWQQSYQNNQPWGRLATYRLWQAGGLTVEADEIITKLHNVNKSANDVLNQYWYSDTLYRRQQEKIAAQEAKRQAYLRQIAAQEANKELTKVTINKGQKVFFIGDSLMQGVAPWAMKTLQTTYGIESINLSKQSTGLSYNTFFDWPKTVEETLGEESSIGLLVVFLGPNDPWAVPDPDKKGPYVPFASERWVQLYHAKMRRILEAAKAHSVSVIWVTPPNTRKKELHQSMIKLRHIIESGADKKEVLLINGQRLLGENEQEYFDSIVIDGNPVKLRTADGIHFTAAGQKIVATAIIDKIEVR